MHVVFGLFAIFSIMPRVLVNRVGYMA